MSKPLSYFCISLFTLMGLSACGTAPSEPNTHDLLDAKQLMSQLTDSVEAFSINMDQQDYEVDLATLFASQQISMRDAYRVIALTQCNDPKYIKLNVLDGKLREVILVSAKCKGERVSLYEHQVKGKVI